MHGSLRPDKGPSIDLLLSVVADTMVFPYTIVQHVDKTAEAKK
jgi:uncharacterized protein YceK